MRFRACCLILVSGLVFAPAIDAQNREADVKTAFARAQHLRRGINTSHWFSQNASDYSAHHTDTETTPQDITTIAQLGFDNVRLSIDATPLEQGFHGGDFLARLDKAVDEILAAGMAVQIDLHPEEAFKEQVRTGNNGVDRLVSLWRKLASHYADRDHERVFFEIMNEPEVSDPYRWAGIQARVAAAIREVAPANTMIATGPNYSDIVDLLTQHPLPDGNVIYNFHFYDPHEFTHQGASWGAPFWIYEHDIPYPPTEDSMAARVKEVPDLADRYKLENYWLDHWDSHRIRLLIDEAANWAKTNNVPLICNEFGVYREKAAPASRLAWLQDVRTALEADSIGWAMWDYHEGFGVAVKDKEGRSVVDPATVEALGLKK
ncbi:MAG TPA: glycoside hydrolase family 5 protein [Terracidiphilus sp.]|nr:glycoside hydrolase family 5 protein [Terracidiphilus sp.]